MGYSKLLSAEKLNSVKRTYLHDCKPIKCNLSKIIDFWDNLSLTERERIFMVYDLKVIDELQEILSMFASEKETSRKSVQMIKLPEKRILLEHTQFDELCSYLSQDDFLQHFLKSFCLIQNKVTNDSQESILEDLDIKDCTDSSLLLGKKRILKFKISSLLVGIIDTLETVVDSFCSGEKVILKKRHYSALFEQLITGQKLSLSSSSEEVRQKLREILELLSIIFENNLIKAFNKTNKYSATKSQGILTFQSSHEVRLESNELQFQPKVSPEDTKDFTNNSQQIVLPSKVTLTSEQEKNELEETLTKTTDERSAEGNDTCGDEGSITEKIEEANKDEKELSQMHNYQLTANNNESEKEKREREERQKMECLIDIYEREQFFQHEGLFFINDGGYYQPNTSDKKEKNTKNKKIQSYKKSEVESINIRLCLVNLSSLTFKPETDNSEGDSDEEFYKVDEKENFHFNIESKDYDIAEILSESFQFSNDRSADRFLPFMQQLPFPPAQFLPLPYGSPNKSFQNEEFGKNQYDDCEEYDTYELQKGHKNMNKSQRQKNNNYFNSKHEQQQQQFMNFPVMPVSGMNNGNPFFMVMNQQMMMMNYNANFNPMSISNNSNNYQKNTSKNNKNSSNYNSNNNGNFNSSQNSSHKKSNQDQTQQQNSSYFSTQQPWQQSSQSPQQQSQSQQQQQYSSSSKNKKIYHKKNQQEKIPYSTIKGTTGYTNSPQDQYSASSLSQLNQQVNHSQQQQFDMNTTNNNNNNNNNNGHSASSKIKEKLKKRMNLPKKHFDINQISNAQIITAPYNTHHSLVPIGNNLKRTKEL